MAWFYTCYPSIPLHYILSTGWQKHSAEPPRDVALSTTRRESFVQFFGFSLAKPTLFECGCVHQLIVLLLFTEDNRWNLFSVVLAMENVSALDIVYFASFSTTIVNSPKAFFIAKFTKKNRKKEKKFQKNRCNEIPICSSFPYLSFSFIIALRIWFSAKCSAILHARVTLTPKMHGCLQILHHWNFHFNVCHVPYICRANTWRKWDFKIWN